MRGRVAAHVFARVRPLARSALDKLADRLAPRVQWRIHGRMASDAFHDPLVAPGPEAIVVRSSRSGDELLDDDLAIPPRELWADYANTPEEYLESGRRDVATMFAALTAAGASASELRRVLDLGCAAGRMLRFIPRGEDRELWGCDVSAQHIVWCQERLPPPFRFATTSTFPHLPFRDGTFDLAFCGSVFTHIGDLADAWLLELRRVVRPGGYLYVTVHTKRSIELLSTVYAGDELSGSFAAWLADFHEATAFLEGDAVVLAIGEDPDSQVFYEPAWLTEKWSRFCDVLSVVEEAHDYQAAVLLRTPV